METNSKDIVAYFENYLEIHPQNTSTFSFISSTQIPTTFVDETTSEENIVVSSTTFVEETISDENIVVSSTTFVDEITSEENIVASSSSVQENM